MEFDCLIIIFGIENEDPLLFFDVLKEKETINKVYIPRPCQFPVYEAPSKKNYNKFIIIFGIQNEDPLLFFDVLKEKETF